jgi:hypothetical protein
MSQRHELVRYLGFFFFFFFSKPIYIRTRSMNRYFLFTRVTVQYRTCNGQLNRYNVCKNNIYKEIITVSQHRFALPEIRVATKRNVILSGMPTWKATITNVKVTKLGPRGIQEGLAAASHERSGFCPMQAR